MTVPLYSVRFAAELILFILSSFPTHTQPAFSADVKKFVRGFSSSRGTPPDGSAEPSANRAPTQGRKNQDGDISIHNYLVHGY